jgi:hypothetical protein
VGSHCGRGDGSGCIRELDRQRRKARAAARAARALYLGAGKGAGCAAVGAVEVVAEGQELGVGFWTRSAFGAEHAE